MGETSGGKDVFLRGRHVVLKGLSEDDVLNSNWYGWFNDEETTRYMQQHYFPNTRESQLEFYRKEIRGNEHKLQLGICDAQGGPLVGVISLNGIDPIARKAELSIVVGEREYRKTAPVVESIELLVSHAFENLNLHRIYGGSLMDELVELLHRTLGFSREGVLREDVYKNGKYNDVFLYGVLKEEWMERCRQRDGERQGAS